MAYEEYYGQDPRIASLLRKRKLAEALMKTGSDTSPAATPFVGLSRVLQGLVGAWQTGTADDEARKMGEAGDAEVEAAKSALNGFNPTRPEAGLTAPAPAMVAPQEPTTAPRTPVQHTALPDPALKEMMDRISEERGLPPGLLPALVSTESGFNPKAINAKSGARGLGQILVSTARDPGYGVTPVADPNQLMDPETNLRFTADYILGRAANLGLKPADLADPTNAAKVLTAYSGADQPQGDPRYVEKVMSRAPQFGFGGGARPQTMAFSGQPAPQQVGLPAPGPSAPPPWQAYAAEAERLSIAGTDALASRNPRTREIGRSMMQKSQFLQSQVQSMMNRADTQSFQQQQRADTQAFQRQTFDLQAQKEAAARGEQRSYEQQQRDAERQYKAVPPTVVFRNLTDKVTSGQATRAEEIEFFNAAADWTRASINPQTGEVIAGRDLDPRVFSALETMKARNTPQAAPGQPPMAQPPVAQGQPAAAPVAPAPPMPMTDIGGVNVSKPGTTKEPPAQVVSGTLGNADALRRVMQARESIEKNPNAVGFGNYALPGPARDLVDPSGVEARARLADLSSMIIHDRSGAAVSALEFPRLKPFLPEPTDTPTTVKKKLAKMEEELRNILNDQYTTYGPNAGYRALPAVEDVLKMKPGQGTSPTLRFNPETGKIE